MFNIVKLSPMSREFVSKLRPSAVLNIAAAKAIANKLPLPSFEVSDPTGHYRESVRSQTNTMVSQLNEVVFINSKEVLELVEGFWKARYVCANPNSSPLVVNKNVVHFFMGYGSAIAFDVFSTIESAGADAIITLRGLSVVIDELNKPEELPQVATESFKKRRSVAHEGIMDFVKKLFGKKKEEEQKPTIVLKTLNDFMTELNGVTIGSGKNVELPKSIFGNIKSEKDLISFYQELVDLSTKRFSFFNTYLDYLQLVNKIYASAIDNIDMDDDDETSEAITNKVFAARRVLIKKAVVAKLLPKVTYDKYDTPTFTTTSESLSIQVDPDEFTLSVCSSPEDTSKETVELTTDGLSKIKELLETIIKNHIDTDNKIDTNYIDSKVKTKEWEKIVDYVDSDEYSDYGPVSDELYGLSELPFQDINFECCDLNQVIVEALVKVLT